MSATGEGDIPAPEVTPAEVPATNETEKVEKPVKEKKTKAPKVPKEKKPKQPKAALHPPYFQMIKEALLALNEKSGSSPYAIAKYMEEKHKSVLPANFKKILGLQLKNSAAKGKLMKIKASYKLSEAGKKEKGSAKPKQEKSTTAKIQKANPEKKSERTKKPVKSAKKVTAAKKTKKAATSKPKQPKSIKSPAAKRAKKAVA